MSSSKMFDKYRDEIMQYCIENGLDFDKLSRSSLSWNDKDEFMFVQHFDPEKGKRGLLDETPSTLLLTIEKIDGELHFEQTEHTQKYLSA